MRLLDRIHTFTTRWKPLWALWVSFLGTAASVEHLVLQAIGAFRTLTNSAEFKQTWANVRELIQEYEAAKARFRP